jgi:hypothetical protein|tara:strand:+ start:499 stop:735 length:237 start_codon:yes stop_codon:yes gene_type:complete
MEKQMKQRTMEASTEVEAPVNVVTKAKMEETLESLRVQHAEAQTRTVMLQGAIQVTELQLEEMNNPSEENKSAKNGVK